MENTLKNKAKFFAQYWDQDVIKVDMPGWDGKTRVIDSLTMESDSLKLFTLMLKKPNSITDEEALMLSEMKYSVKEYITIANGICMVSCNENLVSLMQIQIDFLRQKGYAIPFMGLSVEKLVEYGWVKLNSKTN